MRTNDPVLSGVSGVTRSTIIFAPLDSRPIGHSKECHD
jgi:hypothetical protein